MLVEPFPRHNFKGIRRRACEAGLDGLALGAGVNALGNEFFCLFPAFSGLLKANGGIYAKRDSFLLALKAVFKPPPLAPTGGNFKIKAAAVKIFGSLLCRF